jgi:hypothetical protein
MSVFGHAYLEERKRRAQWYAKYSGPILRVANEPADENLAFAGSS